MVKILNHEFDIEILDIDVSSSVFGKIDATEEALAAIPSPDGSVESITDQQSAMFEAWKDGLDGILGEGSTQELLGGKRHVGKMREAWDDLVDGICEQYIAFSNDSADRRNTRNERVAKYSAANISKR